MPSVQDQCMQLQARSTITHDCGVGHMDATSWTPRNKIAIKSERRGALHVQLQVVRTENLIR